MNIEKFEKIIGNYELCGNKICIENGLHEVIGFLKNNDSCDMLKSITAIDLGDQVELVYNLYSTIDQEDILISIKVQYEAESIVDIFDSAKAEEEEIYDMFGILFIGHEDLKRLYMPENWQGYPLRKDYVQDDTRLAWNDINSDNA